MVASRTPQPAIEIGSIVISAIGGTIKNTCSKLAGATMERTAHQAITTVSTWMEIDSTASFGPVLRLKMTRLAITEQMWACRVGHHFCSHGQLMKPKMRKPRP